MVPYLRLKTNNSKLDPNVTSKMATKMLLSYLKFEYLRFLIPAVHDQ